MNARQIADAELAKGPPAYTLEGEYDDVRWVTGWSVQGLLDAGYVIKGYQPEHLWDAGGYHRDARWTVTGYKFYRPERYLMARPIKREPPNA